MFRAFKLAKYLPAFGFRPIVITTDTNYVYLEDASLLPQLPPEGVVIRARYVEPTLRGLRMLAGGEPRTTATLFAGEAPTPEARVSTAPRDGLGALGRRAYERLLSDWVQVPDRYNTWVEPAIEACERAVAEYGARIIWRPCSLPVSQTCEASDCLHLVPLPQRPRTAFRLASEVGEIPGCKSTDALFDVCTRPETG